MGGVIVDVHLARAIEKFKALGVKNADEFIDSSHHKGLFIDFENGNIDTEQFCNMLGKQVGKEIPREAIEDAWKSIISPPLEYKIQYIKVLKEKYRLFILTNNNPIIMGWARSKEFSPTRDSFSDIFDKIFTSYEMKCTKPDLKIFRMMLEDARIHPEESLYIDDSPRNLVPARELGMKTLHVENASDWRGELEKMLEEI